MRTCSRCRRVVIAERHRLRYQQRHREPCQRLRRRYPGRALHRHGLELRAIEYAVQRPPRAGIAGQLDEGVFPYRAAKRHSRGIIQQSPVEPWCDVHQRAPLAAAHESAQVLRAAAMHSQPAVIAIAEELRLRYQFVSRLITLTVHSSLDAVGFLAAITARLAEACISVNAVSAFHHDHLFVPVHRADEALGLLQRMSSAGSSA